MPRASYNRSIVVRTIPSAIRLLLSLGIACTALSALSQTPAAPSQTASPTASDADTPDSAADIRQPGGRLVLVLPFDNRSGQPNLNWIGDSFPYTLDQRLTSAGFLTISADARQYALDHLGLPTGFKPSRATTIRIAQ